MSTMLTMFVASILLSSALYAHKGPHHDFPPPLFKTEDQDGNGSIFWGKAGKNIMINVSIPIPKVMLSNDDAKDKIVTDKLLNELSDFSKSFQLKESQSCKVKYQKALVSKNHRSLKDKLKELPAKEREKFIEPFEQLKLVYKISCNPEDQVLHVTPSFFDKITGLKSIAVSMSNGKEKSQLQITKNQEFQFILKSDPKNSDQAKSQKSKKK